MPGYLKSYAFVLTGNGIAALLSFLTSVVLSRAMSVEDFGIYSLFFSVFVLAWQIPSFIDSSYVRCARAAGPDRARAYLRVNIVFKARAVLLLLAVSPAAGFGLSRWVFGGKVGPGILIMGVAGGACLTFLTSFIAHFQVREEFARYSLGSVAFNAGNLAVLAFLAARGRLPVMTVAAAFLATGGAAGIIAFVTLARRAGRLIPLDRKAAAHMLGLGRWILFTILLLLLLQKMDMFFAGHFLSKPQMGIYSAASRLLSILSLFITAAVTILLPRSALAGLSPAGAKAYWREAGTIAGLVLLVLSGLFAAAPMIVSFFFGAPYSGAATAFRALLIGQVPYVLALPAVYFLYGLEDTASNFLAMAAAFVVNSAANLVLTPRLGLTGPGWAYGAGYTAYLGAVLFFFFRRRRRPGVRGRSSAMR
jgi:O-antigen/teichoic acid export membrane protein